MLDVDPVLVRHALFNLLHNAAQAAPGKTITVELAEEVRDQRPGWRIAVCDQGAGIAPEIADKLFTPFFSTRPGGTGLGLSVARHIAMQHGGALSVQPNPQGGARFILWLPQARP